MGNKRESFPFAAVSYRIELARIRAPQAGSAAAWGKALTGLARGTAASDAGDVGGEEVDAMSVEVAAGAVVVLGGSRVCVAGEDLRVA